MRRIATCAAAVALAVGLITVGTSSASPSRVECGFTKTPDEPPARPVSMPHNPWLTKGKVRIDIPTSQGSLPLVLDRKLAPCTVHNFVHLAQRRFFDRTDCHRLTAYPTLKVLQCGDPTGTSEGGPGYKFSDELPTWLKPAPNDPTGERRIYPRGLVAMANAGPDTNGSQFFLVQSDSVLRPNYTVFGFIEPEGLKTLDKIAAGGIEGENPLDGKPKTRAHFYRVRPC